MILRKSYVSHHPNRFDAHVTASALRKMFPEQKFVLFFRNLEKHDQILWLQILSPDFFIYFNIANNVKVLQIFSAQFLKNEFKVCQKQDLHIIIFEIIFFQELMGQ